MKGQKLSAKAKDQFRSDFTAVLTLSLASNAKGLSKQEMQNVKQCLKERRMAQALRIIESKYSHREWKDFVEAQAAPLLKHYA